MGGLFFTTDYTDILDYTDGLNAGGRLNLVS